VPYPIPEVTLLLWWLMRATVPMVRQRLGRVAAVWIPYVAALACYVAWRLLLFAPPAGIDRNTPRLLFEFFSDPAGTAVYLFRTALQDTMIVALTSWFKTVSGELIGFSSVFDWAAVAVMAAAFAAAAFTFSRIASPESADRPMGGDGRRRPSRWARWCSCSACSRCG
jgi:hypothetical protein